MLKLRLYFLLLVLFLSGCGLTHVNRVNPSANYDQDRASCAFEAERSIPFVPIQVAPQAPRYATNCTRIGNTVTCDSVPMPSAQNQGFNQLLQDNQVRSARFSYIDKCLSAKGWRLERVN